MFNYIKKILIKLGIDAQNNPLVDENGEPYTPEELRNLAKIRNKNFNYKNEFERIQIRNGNKINYTKYGIFA